MPGSPRERLRTLRERLGLSLAAFGERIGCAASSLSMIESGERFPGLQLALEIEKVAGIAPKDWAVGRKRKTRRAA